MCHHCKIPALTAGMTFLFYIDSGTPDSCFCRNDASWVADHRFRGKDSLRAISVNEVHHDHHYRQEQDSHKDTGFQKIGNPIATRTHDQRIHLVGRQ